MQLRRKNEETKTRKKIKETRKKYIGKRNEKQERTESFGFLLGKFHTPRKDQR